LEEIVMIEETSSLTVREGWAKASGLIDFYLDQIIPLTRPDRKTFVWGGNRKRALLILRARRRLLSGLRAVVENMEFAGHEQASKDISALLTLTANGDLENHLGRMNIRWERRKYLLLLDSTPSALL
jgi:hypothetical protein